jgi:hypothetical protein
VVFWFHGDATYAATHDGWPDLARFEVAEEGGLGGELSLGRKGTGKGEGGKNKERS